MSRSEQVELKLRAWNTRAPSALPVSGWRDIATSPRDGTPILAGSINHKCREVVCWQDGLPRGQIEVEGAVEEGWVNDGQLKDRFHANPNYFTHWQPLPSPPSEPGVK